MKIKLTPFTERDIERILSWTKTEEFLLIWSGPVYKFKTLKEQLKSDLEFAEKNQKQFKMFSVIDSENLTLVGHAQVTIDSQNDSAHISRILIGDESMRGQGIGLQIIKSLLEIIFQKLQLHRATLNVYDFNLSAIKCYESAGFKAEGHLKENNKFLDRYWSTIPMAILRSEYLKV
ncbi:GNAT family N-acetyltransferase [Leptospira kanakyensis]|uniref:GNAT family N-acetyltransferase n=1 Tax=Leptospira kanakyensis TaxID=2484968 RepID=UPI00223CE67B|nr:GNAT family protein [Leptospira kanakyensis]MCW7479556.1 GNAT family N-acetyltransferase [Leptospira kanakyensis]